MLQVLWPGSLQARLALFCSLAILLVSVLLCGVAYLQDRAHIRALQLRHTETALALLADDIDERVRSRQVMLEQAAANLQPSAEDIRQHGVQLIRQFRFLKGSFSSVVLYSADGRIVADFPELPGRRGLDVSDRDYFVRTRQELRGTVSDPLETRGALKRQVVVFTAPILDAHGQFAGMLGGSLELRGAELFGELDGMRLGNSGHLSLFTRPKGVTLFHPQPEQLLRQVKPLPGSVLASVLQGHSGSETAASGEVRVYRGLHNVDWVLAGVVPAQEANLVMAGLAGEYLLLLLLALLLAVPLAWLGTQRLLRPLTALQRKIRAMPAGKDADIAVEGCAELQTLAATVADVYQDRRRIADKLSLREAMFQVLNEASPLGVFVCDAEGVLSYGNRAVLAMAGMERGAAYWFGRRWLEAVHSSDYQQVLQDWKQWIRDGSGEFRCCFRLNHVRHAPLLVALQCSRMTVEGEARFLAVMEDISERESNRSALAAERERLQGLLQAVGDAVIFTNQHDEVLQLNAPARQLLALKQEEAQGRNLALFVVLNRPDGGAPVSPGMLTELYAEQTLALDMLGRDLRRLPVQLTLSVVSAAGSMEGYKVWVLRKDTQRRYRPGDGGDMVRDTQTGLLNRRGMLSALGAVLADGSDRQQAHCVLWLELRQEGMPLQQDVLLASGSLQQAVAGLLLRRLRSSDCLARLEDGVFAALLYRCSAANAERISDDIVADIAPLLAGGEDSTMLGIEIAVSALQDSDTLPQDVLQRVERRSRKRWP